jgi:hypothetical protein
MPSLRLALLVALGIFSVACGDKDNGTGPEVDRRAISLAVGEVRAISSADTGTVRINGGASGAEFTLVTLYGAVPAAGQVSLEFSGEQLTVATGPPMPRVSAAGHPHSRPSERALNAFKPNSMSSPGTRSCHESRRRGRLTPGESPLGQP